MPLRPELTELPERLASLPVDERGYPVPWFVAWVEGKPEFRIADPRKLICAVNEKRCWVCGQRLGANLAFVIGPMCSINRISSEPPSHRECAEWSIRNCPFLARPQMHRRENDLPETVTNAGIMLPRNPQVNLIWITRSFHVIRDPEGKPLFELGPALEMSWWKEGRVAIREEIVESIESGLPALRAVAEEQGPDAAHSLEQQVVAAESYLASL